MKRVYAFGLSSFLVAQVQAGCGSSGGAGQTVRGAIADVNGDPISGVKVLLGDDQTTSNAKGEYELQTSEKSGTIRFSKAGYLAGLERVEIQKFVVGLNAVLLKRGPKTTIDAASGGEALGARGSRVAIPKGSIVDKSGKTVSGDVDVYITPMDPSLPEELKAAPGDFVARDGDGDQLLESLGMVDITVEQDGEELNVKEGEVFLAVIPAPASVPDPPAEMPLYSFDEVAGVWRLEGTATYSAAAGGYEAELPHLSTWNCDQPMEATCQKGRVVDQSGNAVQGARIRGSGVSYTGQSETVTDENGQFALAVRKNSQVDIIAEHPDGGGQSRRVDSGGEQSEVPARVSDSNCTDGGTWVVEPGKFDSNGEKKDCSEYADVFSGNSCLEEFGLEMGKCGAKLSGDCSTEVSSSGSVTTFSDGSKMVQTESGQEVYDGDGKLCYETSFDVTGDLPLVKYDFGDGGIYEMEISQDSEWTILCPSGESFKITKEQSAALSACQPDAPPAEDPMNMGGSSSAGGCKVIIKDDTGTGGTDGVGGTSSSGGTSPTGGGSPSSGGSSNDGFCTTVDECATNEVCCDIGQDILICTDEATCDAIMAAASGGSGG
jgi:hypothetical protein